jgi:hypothetical protein
VERRRQRQMCIRDSLVPPVFYHFWNTAFYPSLLCF